MMKRTLSDKLMFFALLNEGLLMDEIRLIPSMVSDTVELTDDVSCLKIIRDSFAIASGEIKKMY